MTAPNPFKKSWPDIMRDTALRLFAVLAWVLAVLVWVLAVALATASVPAVVIWYERQACSRPMNPNGGLAHCSSRPMSCVNLS